MFYGSKAVPKRVFGEGTDELKAFNQAVEHTVPILGEMMALMKQCWNPSNTHHCFTLPDGHKVVLPTLVDKSMRVEILGSSFTYKYQEIGTDANATSLLANAIHACDSYIAREMVRRCPFELVHIHDSFWTACNNFNTVRQTYIDILVEIAKSNLLEDICSEITGSPVKLEYTDPKLYEEIELCEYALS